MKKFLVVLVIFLTSMVLLAGKEDKVVSASSGGRDYRGEHLKAIQMFKGKTRIPSSVLRGIFLTETAGAYNLGQPGRGISCANSIEDGVGVFLLQELIPTWPRDWRKVPASRAGALSGFQFLPTTFFWLMGVEIVLPNHPIVQKGRLGNVALQKELKRQGFYSGKEDGLIGRKTEKAILSYILKKHDFKPLKSERSYWRLARMAKILVIKEKYLDHVTLRIARENISAEVMQRIKNFPENECMDPFTPTHSVAATVSYLEYLADISPFPGEKPMHFAIRAYNQGPGNAKRNRMNGSTYLKKVLSNAS